MCRILEVSQSGYYRWLSCPRSKTDRENQKIYDVLKDSYNQNKGRVGLDKLLDDVRLRFPHCSRNRLYRIQRHSGKFCVKRDSAQTKTRVTFFDLQCESKEWICS
jgi:putative transposase